MSVSQLKDGRWICQYPNPNPPPRLKREYFGRGIEGESLARARNNSLGLRSMGRRGQPNSEIITFETLVDMYLTARLGHIEGTTLERLIIKLRKIILPEIAKLDWRRITHYRIDQYVKKRLTGGVWLIENKKVERGPVKRVTVNGEVTYIQAILNWAANRKYINQNPLAGYDKPQRDDEIIQPVTAEESRLILASSPAHLVRALALSYYTGLRPGKKELLRLKWSAVDWDLNTILVRSARRHGPTSRTVPIHDEFLPILKGWHEADISHGHVDNYIILYRGKPVDRISKAFASAKIRAGITRKLPPYAFRHAFVTNLLGAGGDLKSVSEIAGHSRPDTTMKIYQHTNLTLHKKEINKLPALDIPKGE